MFEESERLIFKILKRLAKLDLVLIGGHALSAFVPPRFSIDCDLVVRRKEVVAQIGNILAEEGFEKFREGETVPRGGEFVVYMKRVGSMRANFDILIGAVTDRLSGASFDANWIFEHSKVRRVWAKASPISVRIRTADPEILFIMKLLTARKQDIRDVFMLAQLELDWKYVKEYVLAAPRQIVREGIRKCRNLVTSREFKDGLQGVFGKIEIETFERSRRRLMSFLDEFALE
ncbi:MAG: nucleotidyl transferase AbiEii/AbiGii toxin family protein [Candidatus Hadarchaeales archaeon]